jgi:hypothetical protein
VWKLLSTFITSFLSQVHICSANYTYLTLLIILAVLLCHICSANYTFFNLLIILNFYRVHASRRSSPRHTFSKVNVY